MTLVPSLTFLVLAATNVSISIGSYTVAKISGQGSPSNVSFGFVGRSMRSLTHREANPIFSASVATRRIVLGEAIVPYCGRAIPTATFDSSDRLMALGTRALTVPKLQFKGQFFP